MAIRDQFQRRPSTNEAHRVLTKKERKALKKAERQAQVLPIHNGGRKKNVIQHYNNNSEPITIVVVEDDGTEGERINFVPLILDHADVLALAYSYEIDDKGHLVLFVPRKGYRVRADPKAPVKPKPLMCGYHATQDYLKSLHGIMLSYEDQTFYEEHPLIVKDGLSAAYTLRVIQELIEPYGMRIARVQHAPGTSLSNDLAKWLPWLGVNPMALADRFTTNAEFAEAVGLSLDECKQLYRWEFTDIALRPAIHCSVGGSGTGVVTGATGGHASYRGPRGRQSPAEMSIQLSRVERDPWPNGSAPVFEPLEAYKEPPVPMLPDLYGMYAALPVSVQDKLPSPYSRTIKIRPSAQKMNLGVYSPPASNVSNQNRPVTGSGNIGTDARDEAWKHHDGGTSKVVDPRGKPRTQSEPHADYCCACNDKKDSRVIVSGPFCIICWSTLFYELGCLQQANGGVCKTDWMENIPSYRGHDRALYEIHFLCPKCNVKHTFSKKNDDEWYKRLALISITYALTGGERTLFVNERDKRVAAMTEISTSALGSGAAFKEETYSTSATESTGAGAGSPS